VDEDHSSQKPHLDYLSRFSHERAESVLLSDRKAASRRLRSPHDFFSFLGRQTQRLFQQNVLAGSQSGTRRFSVEMMRQGKHNGIDARVAQGPIQVGKRVLTIEPLREFPRVRQVPTGKVAADPRAQPLEFQRMDISPKAATN